MRTNIHYLRLSGAVAAILNKYELFVKKHENKKYMYKKQTKKK